MKICVIIGTRPDIIKTSPLLRELEKEKVEYFVIHTNQHYVYNLEGIFFDELGLQLPEYDLEGSSGTHGEATARMLIEIEKVLLAEKPYLVVVLGDTNTTLAGALAAAKLHIKIAHIEAGLRSFERAMPEETNRVIVDHISNYHFAPTNEAMENLLNEGIKKETVYVTGNTIVDAVYQNLDIAMKKSNILDTHSLTSNGYFLVAFHREENTDCAMRLKGILNGLKLVEDYFDIPMFFPVHPRTARRIREFELEDILTSFSNLKLANPVGFLDFLMLEANARLIFSDSGGVQEESCILKVPCVTMRDNTERPETIEVGSNTLAGVSPVSILEGARKMVNARRDWQNPLGDGKAAKRILGHIKRICRNELYTGSLSW